VVRLTAGIALAAAPIRQVSMGTQRWGRSGSARAKRTSRDLASVLPRLGRLEMEERYGRDTEEIQNMHRTPLEGDFVFHFSPSCRCGWREPGGW